MTQEKEMSDKDFDEMMRKAIKELTETITIEKEEYSSKVKSVRDKLAIETTNFSPALYDLLSEKSKINISESIADLFIAPENIKNEICSLKGKYHSNINTVVKYTQIFSELNTKRKFKQFVLDTLVEGKPDMYGLTNSKFEMPTETWSKLYDLLVNVTNIRTSKPKPLRTILKRWEEVGLDLILDEKSFFIKTKDGNEGTISEFVGHMINFNLPNKNSIYALSGVYLNKVKSKIKYNDIITKKIRNEDSSEQDKRVFEHQLVLLRLLSRVEGNPKSISYNYWQPIENNPSFANFSLEIALKKNKPSAERIVVEMIKEAYEKEKDDFNMFVKKQEMSIQGLNNYLYYKRDAWDKFIDNKDNKFEEYRNILQINNVKYPNCIRYFKGPEIVVVMDYKKKDNTIKVEYIEIKDTLIKKTATFEVHKGNLGIENTNTRNAIFEIANEFDTFNDKFEKVVQKYYKKRTPK